MKMINKERIIGLDEAEFICSEKTILTSIDHPFIVPLRFAFQTQEKLFLIMDFINGGELFTHIRNQGCIMEDQAKIYIAEMILALEYLHKSHIIHRDLKPENILLSGDGHVALTDFGLATLSTGINGNKTICGTTEYMAPEMINGNGYNESIDIWALGTLSFELFKGEPPFRAKNKNKLYGMILKSKPKCPGYLSPACASFLKGLLEKDVNKRLGVKDGIGSVKSHPFFKNLDWDALEKKQIETPIRFDIDVDDHSQFDVLYTEEPLPDLNDQIIIHPKENEDFAGFSYISPSLINDLEFPNEEDIPIIPHYCRSRHPSICDNNLEDLRKSIREKPQTTYALICHPFLYDDNNNGRQTNGIRSLQQLQYLRKFIKTPPEVIIEDTDNETSPISRTGSLQTTPKPDTH